MLQPTMQQSADEDEDDDADDGLLESRTTSIGLRPARSASPMVVTVYLSWSRDALLLYNID